MNRLDKINRVKMYLLNTFVGREDVINGVLAGIISGEPTLLIGPPGTAKTSIIDTLSRLVSAKYFYYLLTKFTEPEELLGPIDINALKNGEYKNITRGKPPDANIIFLDEVFKASSAIRNTLLDIMLNKRIPNGNSMVNLDILGIYSASNEVTNDEEDMALFDRYPIKIFHNYIEKTLMDSLLIKGIEIMERPENVSPLITIDDLKDLQNDVISRLSKFKNDGHELLNRYTDALLQLEENNVVFSDRRKIKILKIAAAFSILMNSNEITGNDIAMAMRYSIDSEEDMPKIDAAIMESKLENKSELVQKATTIIEETRSLISNTEACIQKNSPYKEVVDNLDLLAIYIRKLQELEADLSGDTNPYHQNVLSKIDSTIEYAKNKYEKLKVM
ncbi:AAA family ATPase [Picrophilus oshimae]|uniref:MoxR-like ATPase n=1 Tax=Picrophilus torridus (strain ATCC 700027 / DSM 9790 / JCM 10055 / NBRC 100828 / KAW 2/3) TaxID=1122961 RepID=A0A8G2FX55_PICTO|nr:AAA family ATPase [Picrophilus oshimae]SMD31117.1 MoxR-like ATPase [Picrophilus oshimae DSM 9789]